MSEACISERGSCTPNPQEFSPSNHTHTHTPSLDVLNFERTAIPKNLTALASTLQDSVYGPIIQDALKDIPDLTSISPTTLQIGTTFLDAACELIVQYQNQKNSEDPRHCETAHVTRMGKSFEMDAVKMLSIEDKNYLYKLIVAFILSEYKVHNIQNITVLAALFTQVPFGLIKQYPVLQDILQHIHTDHWHASPQIHSNINPNKAFRILCDEAETNLESSMKRGVAPIINNGLLVKHVGKPAALCTSTILTQNGAFIKGCWYMPDKHTFYAIEQAFIEQGNVIHMPHMGTWFLMRRTDLQSLSTTQQSVQAYLQKHDIQTPLTSMYQKTSNSPPAIDIETSPENRTKLIEKMRAYINPKSL